MIDTIVLTLNTGMYTIFEPDFFSPSTRGLTDPTTGYYRLGGRSNITCKQNPTANELKRGLYKPRLTVTKRINREGNFEMPLKIEFSIPKLLYGNNFDELTDTDFPTIIQKLKAVLKEMGVYLFEKNLINAPVSSVHYSKNIALTDYTTPYTYLEQLTKLNINKRLDTNRTDFRNEGHSFKYRANSFEIVFYDKIKDLEQAKISEKRAEEKDNALQLGLFDVLTQRKPFEVLRVEIRLNKRQKINQILNKIGKKVEPTFTNIFNQDTAKRVLLYYINEIEEAYPTLLTYQYDSPKKFFERLLVANPKLKPTQALELTGFRMLLEEIGVRDYRQMTKRHGNYYWYSLNKKIQKLNYADEVSVFSLLRKQITDFEPLKLLANQEEMLNNVKYS
ncbi:hypothetical protein M1615_04305 [Patescibacteria group bacterium]|nr:hypothetical protein [Patescibacteria group bacterium]MCL5010010.1 hypothetical protein [Patescibacteria group bacterium]